MTRHILHATPETCRAGFSPECAPAITIDPGDTVALLDVPDVAWGLDPPVSTTTPRRKMEPRDPSGPCLCGPIAVRGARAGRALAIRIDEVRTADWGFTYAGSRDIGDPKLNQVLGVADEPEHLLSWRIDHDAHLAINQHDHRVRLDPFPGCIGLSHAPGLTDPAAVDPWRPRRTGGNMDCRLLTTGTTLLLPVEADGALLSVGDVHAAQGDGECSGTAIETMGARITLACALAEPRLEVDTPIALAPAGLITLGFAETVDAAIPGALGAMLDVLTAALAIHRAEAFALASAAVHIHVTQLVNRTVGAQALLPVPWLDDNGIDLARTLGIATPLSPP